MHAAVEREARAQALASEDLSSALAVVAALRRWNAKAYSSAGSEGELVSGLEPFSPSLRRQASRSRPKRRFR